MASITYSDNAGSFTSTYDLELRNKVKIDGQRARNRVEKNSSDTGDMYEVMLDGTEFIITVRAERLAQFATESESECRSTSKPT